MGKVKKRLKSKTVKQSKFLHIFSENLGNTKNSKSLYQMFLEAGYSESSARQQSTILAGMKEDIDALTVQLERLRQSALDRLDKKINTASYRDLIHAMDKLTKNILLLSGGVTEVKNVNLSDDQFERLRRAVNKRHGPSTGKK